MSRQVWYVWRSNKRMPERKGQMFTILVESGMGSVLVKFRDGTKVLTGKQYIRR